MCVRIRDRASLGWGLSFSPLVLPVGCHGLRGREEPDKHKGNMCELHSTCRPGSGALGVDVLCFKECLAIPAGSFFEGVFNGATAK